MPTGQAWTQDQQEMQRCLNCRQLFAPGGIGALGELSAANTLDDIMDRPSLRDERKKAAVASAPMESKSSRRRGSNEFGDDCATTIIFRHEEAFPEVR
jgi:hypothetical protein